MADNHYKHGEMDISEQEKTFDGFMRWTVRVGIASLLVILFLLVFAR